MKNKFKYLVVLILSIVAIVFAGCKKNSELEVRELDPENDWEIFDAIIASEDEGIPFPDGSKLTKDQNGMYIITLPKGYFYLVSSTNERDMNQPEETQVIGVNCNCTEGKGCDPATFDNKLYCIMKSGCFNCIRTNINEKRRGSFEEVQVLGLLNRNVGITLLCDKDVPESKDDLDFGRKIIRGVEVIHGNAFEELFEVPDVYTYFDDLSNCFLESGIKPNSLAYMNIFGNVALMPYYLEEGESVYYSDGVHYYAKTAPGNNPEPICRCDSNTIERGNKCELDKIVLFPYGTGYRCVSNGCSSCTMLIPK